MATRERRPPPRLEEVLLRRFELCRAGFTWDPYAALWRRGRLALTDEEVDRRLGWRRSVQGWMRTRPRRRRTGYRLEEDL
jgi:hypothetical protein